MAFRDHHREANLFASRLIWSMAVVLLLTAVLAGRMIWLQAIEHDRYTTLSDKNRVQTLALSPPRGLITDRNGNVLADNHPDFSVSLVPELVTDFQATLAALKTQVDIDEADVERFQRRLRSPRRPWEPVPLRARLSDEELARIVARQHEMPGVRIEATALRYYPHAEALSHVVGYVNRINTDDLGRMTPEQQANYSNTHYYGRSGVERQYENLLHGKVGFRRVETNARGRILQVLAEQPPIPGRDLQLHLDLELQLAVIKALDNRRGAVVAIDPRDGGILALVSKPGFDPNLFVTGISHNDYAGYRDDLDRPLFNRVLQGQYPPGSTIKSMVGLAGLKNDTTDWQHSINDRGYFRLPGQQRVFRDWRRQGHGIVDMHKAIVQSCDTYFYEMAYELGIDEMSRYLAHFGFGQPTGIDLPNEMRGINPSRDWKRGALGQSWFHGDTINASIGQGYALATPLQLARAIAIQARKGEPFSPRVAALQEVPTVGTRVPVGDPSDWEKMHQALVDVVHGPRGTARLAGLRSAYQIAGKTGTSQVFSLGAEEEYDADELEERLRDHALFVGYAPADNPSIALAVLVENGGSGGGVAAPIAREVMDAWLLDEQGQLRERPSLTPGVPANTGIVTENQP